MHDLVLFWASSTAEEVRGFNTQPVEFALYLQQPVLLLLYRITNVCEWSDVAYNIHQRLAEKRFPQKCRVNTHAYK